MYYEVHGKGVPLLVLHGFTGSGAGLESLFKPLTATHQLIIPDLRGHGRSTNPSQQFTFQQSAAEWEMMRNTHQQGDEQIRMLWEQARTLSESDNDMNFTPESLAKIKTKTLLIQGDRDPLYPLDLTIEMYKSIPNSYLWIIPNGGHVPIQENVEIFIQMLTKFLS